jgi:alpha-D-ribose 1-methylphosphonate 5-triphosphate synthase subunit PhnG
MFQASDGEHGARREWVGVLARAPLPLLERGLQQLGESAALPDRSWLRRPETGLVMLRGRIGGTGERFNLGEMTVTRCALRVESGEVGVAYVGGRSHRKAELAALADALLQSARWRDGARQKLIEPARAHLEAQAARGRRKAQATRVEFFTLAREAAAAGSGDERA